MATRAAGLAIGIVIVIVPLSACQGSNSSDSAAHHAPLPKRVACDPSNLTAAPDGAWSQGGIWLKLRTRDGMPCTFAARPSVIVDSGYGPDPAIDGTADPDAEVVTGMVVPPSGLRLLVSWDTGCEPNHKAPVVRLMVGPLGQERIPVSANAMPKAVGRVYCWNDGVELGTRAPV